MNQLLLFARWGVGEVLIVIAILVLLFGDKKTWHLIKRTTRTWVTTIRTRRCKPDA